MRRDDREAGETAAPGSLSSLHASSGAERAVAVVDSSGAERAEMVVVDSSGAERAEAAVDSSGAERAEMVVASSGAERAETVVTASGAEREEAVVAAARAGDPIAVDELLGMLGPPLLRAVRALMGPSHPDLEDLVQDVLIA